MVPVLSREQIRAFDRHASTACSVPSLLLMENAGRGAAELIREVLAKARPGPVLVVCGAGNNGGDGFVVARRLLTLGVDPRVALVSPAEKLKGDARTNYEAYCGLGGSAVELADESALAKLEELLASAAVVVDALLGTGLDRAIEGHYARVIEAMNGAAGVRIALDIPSGLDADTGVVLGTAVRAHHTVTFAHPKLGLLTSTGADHIGRLRIVDIGVPAELETAVGRSAELVESQDVRGWVTPRTPALHKGAAGRVVAIAGAPGKSGAALLVARGALRAGAGLVTIASSRAAVDALDRRVLEEMTTCIDAEEPEASLDAILEAVDAVAIGPGLGHDEWASRVVDHVVLRWDGIKVVDADAITRFKDRAGELAKASGSVVLTPHPAEMGRLLGCSAKEVESDRFGALARVVDTTRAVVVLKGRHTLIGAPGVLPLVNASGGPVLATAGAGDVLTGMIAALSCQLSPRLAAASAVHLHGLSAERWQDRTGADRGLLAHEVADGLAAVIAEVAAAGSALTS